MFSLPTRRPNVYGGDCCVRCCPVSHKFVLQWQDPLTTSFSTFSTFSPISLPKSLNLNLGNYLCYTLCLSSFCSQQVWHTTVKYIGYTIVSWWILPAITAQNINYCHSHDKHFPELSFLAGRHMPPPWKSRKACSWSNVSTLSNTSVTCKAHHTSQNEWPAESTKNPITAALPWRVSASRADLATRTPSWSITRYFSLILHSSCLALRWWSIGRPSLPWLNMQSLASMLPLSP